MSIDLTTTTAIDRLRGRVRRLLSGPAGRVDTPRIVRLETVLPEVGPLRWLANQPFDRKVYWRDREGQEEIAGVGIADMVFSNEGIDFHHLQERLRRFLGDQSADVRYFGGLRFSDRICDARHWEPFGALGFVAPRFELSRRRGRTILACQFRLDPECDPGDLAREVDGDFDRLNVSLNGAGSRPLGPVVSRHDTPEPGEWSRQIGDALAQFERGDLDKVVLARQTRLRFDRGLDPEAVLSRLRQANPHAYHFLFQPQSGLTFIGGSPERLYRRLGRHVASEAVAGTRSRGTGSADDRLARELLESEKDRREHRHVIDSVRAALERLGGGPVEPGPVEILKLARVQHLYARLATRLRDGIDDGDLLEELHPTPAVGGYPRREALECISALESFDRGWYAGPVGWIGPDGAEFAVAIRSGLVVGEELYLFAGAGIVPGSDADTEWQEIESKLDGFVRVFKRRQSDPSPLKL